MTFFDEVGKRLSYAVSEVSSRTKEFAAVTKLNNSISAREREIESAYAQIGKLLFEREAADPESPAAALCAKISANREAIDEMRARIVKVKEEQKDARKAKSDELFGKPAASAGAQDASVENCPCCSADADCAAPAESCSAEKAEESSCTACCEAAAEAAEPSADTVSEAAEAACAVADCACCKAADPAETAEEKAESADQNLSDFYKKPDDNT